MQILTNISNTMKIQKVNNKLIFEKHSIFELSDIETLKVFGGTTLIIVTENPVKSVTGFAHPVKPEPNL